MLHAHRPHGGCCLTLASSAAAASRCRYVALASVLHHHVAWSDLVLHLQGERVLPEPRRVKFFNPMMMTIPEELEEGEAESSNGGSSSGPDASGGARGAEPSRKLPEPSGGRSSKGGSSGTGGTSRHYSAISLERSRQLARLLDRLRANDDDVANLRDVADID